MVQVVDVSWYLVVLDLSPADQHQAGRWNYSRLYWYISGRHHDVNQSCTNVERRIRSASGIVRNFDEILKSEDTSKDSMLPFCESLCCLFCFATVKRGH